jgi:hypothetical protein
MKLLKLDFYLLLNWVQEWLTLSEFCQFSSSVCNKKDRKRLNLMLKIEVNHQLKHFDFFLYQQFDLLVTFGLQQKKLNKQVIFFETLTKFKLPQLFSALSSGNGVLLLPSTVQLQNLFSISNELSKSFTTDGHSIITIKIGSYITFHKTIISTEIEIYAFRRRNWHWLCDKYVNRSLISSYVGQMKNNKFHGFGTETNHETKQVYAGGWFNGHRHGSGVMTLKNGDIFEGKWQNGKFDFNAQSKTTCSKNGGEFGIIGLNNMYTGIATKLENMSNKSVYSGDMVDGLYHGKGTKLYVFVFIVFF